MGRFLVTKRVNEAKFYSVKAIILAIQQNYFSNIKDL